MFQKNLENSEGQGIGPISNELDLNNSEISMESFFFF